MGKLIIRLVVLGLIGSAIFLGYQVFLQSKRVDITRKNAQLQDPEQIISNSMENSVPEKDRLNFLKQMEAFSQEAEYLEVANCDLQPIVWKVHNKTNITVKNSGQTDQTITLERKEPHIIPAGQEKQIPLNVDGWGPYLYWCGEVSENKGGSLWNSWSGATLIFALD